MSRGREAEIIRQHEALVKHIVYHFMGHMPPSVQADDLIQAGMIGLLKAARSYDGSHGASFTTYAGIRIRGAILDELRGTAEATRSVMRMRRRIAQAAERVEAREMRPPRDAEVAKEMGITVAELRSIQLRDGFSTVGLEDLTCPETGQPFDAPDPDQLDPADALEALEDCSRDHQRLEAAKAGLNDCERLALSLYYDEDLTLREIAEICGFTESRASQICGSAIDKIREALAA